MPSGRDIPPSPVQLSEGPKATDRSTDFSTLCGHKRCQWDCGTVTRPAWIANRLLANPQRYPFLPELAEPLTLRWSRSARCLPFLISGAGVPPAAGVWTFCCMKKGQSRRDCIAQPRVASSELPWVRAPQKPLPCKGCITVPTGPCSPLCCNHWPGFSCIPSSPPKSAVPGCVRPHYGKSGTPITGAFSST